MNVAGRLGGLFVVQGALGLLIAYLTHRRDLPAPTWILGFLGAVLVSTGLVLWLLSREAAEAARRDEWTERHGGQQARTRGRDQG
jgi:hypothetical protein